MESTDVCIIHSHVVPQPYQEAQAEAAIQPLAVLVRQKCTKSK